MNRQILLDTGVLISGVVGGIASGMFGIGGGVILVPILGLLLGFAQHRAQAEAYRALVAPLLDEPNFAGFFVWRLYSDPDDVSQEAEWGFSPRGKHAESVVRELAWVRDQLS